LAASFWCRAVLAQSWKLHAFNFSGSPSTSKNWRNDSGWRLRGLWSTNACLRDRIEWLSISNAPARNAAAIWQSWCPNGTRQSMTVLEMWLSACAGIGSRENVGGSKPTRFQRWLAGLLGTSDLNSVDQIPKRTDC
jgi:hypothetical protein